MPFFFSDLKADTVWAGVLYDHIPDDNGKVSCSSNGVHPLKNQKFELQKIPPKNPAAAYFLFF